MNSRSARAGDASSGLGTAAEPPWGAVAVNVPVHALAILACAIAPAIEVSTILREIIGDPSTATAAGSLSVTASPGHLDCIACHLAHRVG